jgi:hypothetical protein
MMSWAPKSVMGGKTAVQMGTMNTAVSPAITT